VDRTFAEDRSAMDGGQKTSHHPHTRIYEEDELFHYSLLAIEKDNMERL